MLLSSLGPESEGFILIFISIARIIVLGFPRKHLEIKNRNILVQVSSLHNIGCVSDAYRFKLHFVGLPELLFHPYLFVEHYSTSPHCN